MTLCHLRYLSLDPADAASTQVSELLLAKGICAKVQPSGLIWGLRK